MNYFQDLKLLFSMAYLRAAIVPLMTMLGTFGVVWVCGGFSLVTGVSCLLVFFGCLILSRGMMTAHARIRAACLPPGMQTDLYLLYRQVELVSCLLQDELSFGARFSLDRAQRYHARISGELEIVDSTLREYAQRIEALETQGRYNEE